MRSFWYTPLTLWYAGAFVVHFAAAVLGAVADHLMGCDE